MTAPATHIRMVPCPDCCGASRRVTSALCQTCDRGAVPSINDVRSICREELANYPKVVNINADLQAMIRKELAAAGCSPGATVQGSEFCCSPHSQIVGVNCQLPAGHDGSHQWAGGSTGHKWDAKRSDPTPAAKCEQAQAMSFDARDWAMAFNKQFPSVSADDAYVWFSNSLMRGFDEARWRDGGEPWPAEHPPADPGREPTDAEVVEIYEASWGEQEHLSADRIAEFRPHVLRAVAAVRRLGLANPAPACDLPHLAGSTIEDLRRLEELESKPALHEPTDAEFRAIKGAHELARDANHFVQDRVGDGLRAALRKAAELGCAARLDDDPRQLGKTMNECGRDFGEPPTEFILRLHRELTEARAKYEDLRSSIDGGGESMTHEDAVTEAMELATERDTARKEAEEARMDLVKMERELNEARADVVEAAGELMTEIPAPGTDAARVMIANRIMRSARDRAEAERDQMQQKLAAAREALK